MNTPNILGTPISTDHFTYSKSQKEFVTEMSTIQRFNPLGRLYDDAADSGFVLVSAPTGRRAGYYLVNTQRDHEGDVSFWEFKPTARSLSSRTLLSKGPRSLSSTPKEFYANA